MKRALAVLALALTVGALLGPTSPAFAPLALAAAALWTVLWLLLVAEERRRDRA